jgi:triosephosphate isomerase
LAAFSIVSHLILTVSTVNTERRRLVAGNWKMNGSRSMATALTRAVVDAGLDNALDVVLCPPAPYLEVVGASVAGSGVALGAQDCSEHEPGAYTGEVAASMLADSGCAYVIIGHSERRQMFGDSDARVVAKLKTACAHGLTPIFCVGETLEERRADATETVIGRQLDALLCEPDAVALLTQMVIAYEPVWAIGTGESATPAQAQAVHAAIRARLATLDAGLAARTRILYGGSVKPDNAVELFAMPDIDGGLIGGAALVAASFIAVCRAALA